MSDLADELMKAIGDNAAGQKVTRWIDTGLPFLNKVISGKYDGGVPFGRLLEIYGPSSSGKTALATMIMAKAQKMGGIAGFFDHENSFDVDLAVNFGLDNTYPKFIYKQPYCWEEANIAMEKVARVIREKKLIDPEAPIVFVLDSVASAITKAQADKQLDELTMNDMSAKARVLSMTLPVMAHKASKFNFTVIYLNQVREKIGVMYGPKTTTPGGSTMGFQTSVRLELARTKLMESKEFVGQVINIKAAKNKLTKPFQTCSLTMTWDDNGVGMFDIETSLVEEMIEAGKLNMAGAWLEYGDKKYRKKDFVDKVKADPELYKTLVSLLDDE